MEIEQCLFQLVSPEQQSICFPTSTSGLSNAVAGSDQKFCKELTMLTASLLKGFLSVFSGKCTRTFDLKDRRMGLCSKLSPESQTHTK